MCTTKHAFSGTANYLQMELLVLGDASSLFLKQGLVPSRVQCIGVSPRESIWDVPLLSKPSLVWSVIFSVVDCANTVLWRFTLVPPCQDEGPSTLRERQDMLYVLLHRYIAR